MNKIGALKAVISSKIRATKFDFAALQIPPDVKRGLEINPEELNFDINNLSPAINVLISESGNEISSEALFTNGNGQRYSCWLPGDEKLVDNWLLAENSYPFYFQIYKNLSNSFKNPKLLEFGVRTGYAGVVFAKAISGPSTYIGVDPNLYLEEGLARASQTFHELKKEGFEITPFLLEGFSSSEAIQNSLKFSGPFEFIHIDGEHTFFGKLYDLWIARNLVASNGYVLVDDFDHHNLVKNSIKIACYLGWFKSFSYVQTYRGLGVLKL